MSDELNPKQKRFCLEYIKDCNATQAAIRAGYSKKTAKIIGCQNLTKLNIKNYIEELQRPIIKKHKITAERVIQEIASLAFAEDNKGNKTSKVAGLKMLGQHLKVFENVDAENLVFNKLEQIAIRTGKAKATLEFEVGMPIKEGS
jgi:phage terminase small subunit